MQEAIAVAEAKPSLNAIVRWIEETRLESAGSLILKPELVGSDIVAAFFDKVLKARSLIIHAAKRVRSSTPPGLVVEGRASVLGFAELDVKLGVHQDVDPDEVVISVDVTFPPLDAKTLRVVDWISVRDLKVRAAFHSRFGICDLSFRGTVHCGAAGLPVEFNPSLDGGWRLAQAAVSAAEVKAQELFDLLGGAKLVGSKGLTEFLPQGLVDALKGIAVTGLSVQFDPTSSTGISCVSAAVTVTNGWNPVKGVSLDKLRLTLTVVRPLSPGSREIVGVVTGTFQLGGTTVAVFVQGSAGTSTNWLAGLQPGKPMELQRLSALFDLAGWEAGTLPVGLTALPEVIVEDFLIGFDPTKSSLNEMRFAARSKSWAVVADYFVVDNVHVSLALTDLADSKKRAVQGTVRGTFSIVSVLLQCLIDKSATGDWTMRAGLPPDSKVKVDEIAHKLFGSEIKLPERLRALTFNNLSMTIDPSTGVVQFDASAGDQKSFLEIANFAVEKFALEFKRDPKAKPTISGKFKIVVRIGEFDMTLSAALSETGDAIFKGEGKNLKVRDVTGYLATTFQIKDLPSFIDGITIDMLTVSLDTAKQNFDFAVVGSLALGNAQTLRTAVTISAIKDGNAYTKSLKGTVTMGTAALETTTFEINFAGAKASTDLRASWKQSTKPIGLKDVCSALGLDPPKIPDELDLRLKQAEFTYSSSVNTFVLTAASESHGKSVLVARKPDGNWQFYLGLGVDKTLDLSNLPLIGQKLAELTTVRIEGIKAIAASDTLDQKAAEEIEGLITDKGYPTPPKEGMKFKAGLSMQCNFGGRSIPLSLGFGRRQDDDSDEAATLLPTAVGPPLMAILDEGSDAAPWEFDAPIVAAADTTAWFNVQKSFGPLSIQKIGIRYQDQKLLALMNASLAAGPLTISVLGLGIGSSLKEFKLNFNINGLAITLEQGPVLISGGLVGIIDPVDFYGQLMIRVPEFSIGALGGYAQVAGNPSFFLYATLNAPIGGYPPYFMVKGIAAGLGFNRRLTLPSLDSLHEFPLVQWAMGSGAPSSIGGDNVGKQVGEALSKLQTAGVIAPSIGDYWLAAGLRFSAFELLDCFALATASFGTKFEVGLLGLARLSLPPKVSPPVAFIEMAFQAAIQPETGVMGVVGQLTPNSYLFAPACRLTGGFAYQMWLSGNHAGDLVVTAGGYSLRHKPPVHYPSVPRLGLHWQVTPQLMLTGSVYFAMTSSAVVAGGTLNAVWRSDTVHAWFSVEVDFLMQFVPFRYAVTANCELGADVSVDLLFTRKTISVHLGIGLEIWGPEFSGKAKVDLQIVSFELSFGAKVKPQVKTTIGWREFVQVLLPSKGTMPALLALPSKRPGVITTDHQGEPAIIQLTVAKGLVKTLSNADKADVNDVVDGLNFELNIGTSIPVKELDLQGNIVFAAAELQPRVKPNTNFGCGPTGTKPEDFKSKLVVSIGIKGGGTTRLQAIQVLRNVPKGQWEERDHDSNGVPRVADPLADTTISDVLVGFRIVPKLEQPTYALKIRGSYLKHRVGERSNFAWSQPTRPRNSNFGNATVAATITAKAPSTVRAALLGALGGFGLAIPITIDVAVLTAGEIGYLEAAPVAAQLGEWK